MTLVPEENAGAFEREIARRVRDDGMEPHQAIRVAKRLDVVATFRASLAALRLGLTSETAVEAARRALRLSRDDADQIARDLDAEAAVMGGLGPA